MAASPPSGILGPDGRSLTKADVLRAHATGREITGHSNEGASRRGTFLGNWNASLRSADADWFYDRDQVVARARDASRNDVVGRSAGKRRVNRTIGAGWRLASRANARSLGVDAKVATELRTAIDTEFRLYAKSVHFMADAERTKSFGQLLRLGASHMFHDGEALAIVEYAEDEPTRYRTRLRMVDPDRLCNPHGAPDSPTLRNGVQKDMVGRVIGYWIREAHPYDVGTNTDAMKWRYWPRYSTNFDRPQVLHAFDAERAGQSRGISAFVSALKSLRGLNKFTDATLEATTIDALMIAFAKSSAGPDAVSESLAPEDYKSFTESRKQWYQENPVTIEGVEIPVLPPEDEIVMQKAARDTGGFDAFVRAFLRLIAAALGMTYEELSMDLSQTNYSSIRAGMAIAWGDMVVFSSILADQIASPFFFAWLEEAFDIGAIAIPQGAPSFYDASDAYCEHRWIGPGRGQIDPTKEVDAAAARIEAGLSTWEDECADDGKDWRDVFAQQAVEHNERVALGLNEPEIAPKTTASGFEAVQETHDAQQRDERPAANSRQGIPGFVRGALSRLRSLARSPEHNAALDARPSEKR
jgi:lambda family phage portal protein